VDGAQCGPRWTVLPKAKQKAHCLRAWLHHGCTTTSDTDSRGIHRTSQRLGASEYARGRLCRVGSGFCRDEHARASPPGARTLARIAPHARGPSSQSPYHHSPCRHNTPRLRVCSTLSQESSAERSWFKPSQAPAVSGAQPQVELSLSSQSRSGRARRTSPHGISRPQASRRTQP